MINFKEHDGLLFKMLEEHEIMPLKENDANVLVRFITHGVIGEYVMEHWLDCNQKNVPIYVEGVDSDGDVTVWIDEVHHCCPFPMFEIIGTFVKEGSDDWAWYQMMKGAKIKYSEMTSQRFYAIKEGCDYCALYENDGTEVPIDTRRNYDEFIEYSKWLGTSSWQIYKEPKPEPQYKVGDFVEIRNWYSGYKHLAQIDSIDHEIHIGTHRFDISGKSVMERVPQLNIIRKLKPSEVIVEIGCLSGTVKDLSYVEDGIFWFISKETERCPGGMHCILYLEMLDTPTRKLVEDLLKAQEEEQDEKLQ